MIGIEYVGNDIRAPQIAHDYGACCDACHEDQQCLFFTFDNSSQLCYLKSTNAPDTQRANVTCISGYNGSTPPAPHAPRDVNVTVSNSIHWKTSNHFVCWNIDASANRGFFWRNLSAATPDLYGAQLARQVRQLIYECINCFCLLTSDQLF